MDSLNGVLPRRIMVTAKDGLLCRRSGTRECKQREVFFRGNVHTFKLSQNFRHGNR